MYVCSSVCIEQLGSHRTNFHEIWFFIIFRKYGGKIQVSLKYDIMATTVPADPCTVVIISHSVLRRVRNISDKRWQRKSKHVSCFIFAPPSVPGVYRGVFECMGRITVESDRPDENIKQAHCTWTLNATNPHSEYTYSFCMPTMVTRMCLYVTCISAVHCLSCFNDTKNAEIKNYLKVLFYSPTFQLCTLPVQDTFPVRAKFVGRKFSASHRRHFYDFWLTNISYTVRTYMYVCMYVCMYVYVCLSVCLSVGYHFGHA
jgi:hypothetical protein